MPGGSYQNTHTKDGKKKKGRHLGSGASKPKKKSKKQAVSEAKARAAVAKANVAVAKAVSTTKPSKMKKGYYSKRLGGTKIDGRTLTAEDKDQLKQVRELNKEYESKSTVSKVLLPPPGVGAGDAPLMGSLTAGKGIAGKVIAAVKGGEKKGAAKVAQSGKATGAPRAPKPKPPTAPKSPRAKKTSMSVTKPKRGKWRRMRESTKKEKAARREALGETRRGQMWKQHRPTPISGAPHRVADYVKFGGLPAAPLAGVLAADQLRMQGKAAIEDPKRYAETNLRVAAALPGAVIGDARDIATTASRAVRKAAGEDISSKKVTAPVRGLADEWLQYTKGTYDILAGQDVERINPETGEKETVSPETAILDDYGAMPIATLAGGAYAASRPAIARIRAAGAEHAKGPTAARKAAALTAEADRIAKAEGRGSAAAREAAAAASKAAAKARKAQKQGWRARQKTRRAEAEAHSRAEGNIRAKARQTMAPVQKALDKLARTFGDDVADAVGFLARTGYAESRRDHADVVNDLKRHRDNLEEPSKDLPLSADEPSTRDAIDALLRNEEALDSPELRDALDAYKAYERTNSAERNPAADGSRNPADERSRVLTQAQQMGRNAPPAIIPDDLRSVTDLRTDDLDFELGNAMTALRDEARMDRRRAKTLRHQARVADANGAKQTGIALREAAEGWEDAAKTKTSYANRARLSRRRDAEGLKLQEEGDLHGAAQKFAEAEELIVKAKSDQDKLLNQWLKEVEAERQKRGWDEPAYVRQIDASKSGDPSALLDFPGGRMPPREQMKRGILEREGRVAESAARLLDNMFRGRVGMELARYVDDFVRRRAKLNGDLVTGDQARAAWRAGQLSDTDVLMPLQEFKRYVEADPSKSLGMIEDAFERNVRDAEYEPGKKYIVVDRAALEEFREQLIPSSKGIRAWRHATRAQSLLLLGTSPTWFQFQLAATPLVMLADNFNPRTYFNAYRAYRKMSDSDKAALQGAYGGLPTDAISGPAQHSIVGPQTSWPKTRKAIQTALRTPAGRIVEKAGRFAGIPEGGPLIKGNKAYEAYLRNIFALAKMDKVQNPSLYRKMVESIGVTHRFAADAQKQLRGKSLEEIHQWYNDNPDFMERHAESITDAIGDWMAMTGRERKLASVIAFYPFMRFSLRWTFQAFPKNHPIKMVAALNLAQANAQELERLMGGRPEFFGDWGQILSHTGDGPAAGQSALTTEYAGAVPGNPDQENITGAEGINLARIAPASNAIIEALGGGNRGLGQTIASPFSPAIGIVGSAVYGQDAYSGEPLDDDSDTGRFVAALKGLAGLAGPVRTLLDNEPSEMRRAFANLTGDERNQWQRLLYPDLGSNPVREGAALRLGDALETVANDPETTEIQALYEKWKSGADIKPELTALRQEVDDSEAASKYIDAIMEDQGFQHPKAAGEREARRKFGELYRRVFGEVKIDVPRISADRRKKVKKSSSTNSFGIGGGNEFGIGGSSDFGIGGGNKFGIGGSNDFGIGGGNDFGF